jgi:asparagine synthetase B (glutamine-hydrolysing)
LKTPVLKEEIDLLTDAVAHRGPDGRGIWIDLEGYMALGHRRLSILDLSENGKQPMSYSDDRYWITYNGEVYNFLEIQDELSKKGYSFKSDSDTEIILAAYQEWGRGMLDRFNGMWAFAIYDVAEKSLFLSRDRFGIKPLYYFKDEERFIFSSEVQAIHKILGKKARVAILRSRRPQKRKRRLNPPLENQRITPATIGLIQCWNVCWKQTIRRLSARTLARFCLSSLGMRSRGSLLFARFYRYYEPVLKTKLFWASLKNLALTPRRIIHRRVQISCATA